MNDTWETEFDAKFLLTTHSDSGFTLTTLVSPMRVNEELVREASEIKAFIRDLIVREREDAVSQYCKRLNDQGLGEERNPFEGLSLEEFEKAFGRLVEQAKTDPALRRLGEASARILEDMEKKS